MRNATITTIAPTGTISMIADTSSGIEPLFSIAYTKFALDNKEFVYVNKYFESEAKKRGFYSEELMYKIAREGSIQHLDEVPDDVKKLFVTTHEIDTQWHVKMQAAFQKYVHNAVSKTINMPNNATIDDVKKAYLDAYEMGCKGLTVYREGSRQFEVLTKGTKTKTEEEKKDIKQTIQKLIAKKTPDDECPVCHSKMQRVEGCFTCPKCGYSKCS
jgi:ribonucleoside-diphosphate reductase alpha chain